GPVGDLLALPDGRGDRGSGNGLAFNFGKHLLFQLLVDLRGLRWELYRDDVIHLSGELEVILSVHPQHEILDALVDNLFRPLPWLPCEIIDWDEVVRTIMGDVLPQRRPSVKDVDLSEQVHQPVRC